MASALSGVNLYLLGLPGAGKSSVGRALAAVLPGYTFVDTDDLLALAEPRVPTSPPGLGADPRLSSPFLSIPEIFSTKGEPYFRTLESRVLHGVSATTSNSVVSTGGGILEDPNNWFCLRSGVSIYLRVDPEAIRRRLKKEPGQRPLLTDDDGGYASEEEKERRALKKIQVLLERRRGEYEKADYTVDVIEGRDVKGVVEDIITAITLS